MTAVPPESLVTDGVRSLEVRWIFPGQLETAVARWFGRFPAGTESRQDTYLLVPQLRGLSVKIRGGVALEVKAYRGSPGILEVPGRARGCMESWQKWSFSLQPAQPGQRRPGRLEDGTQEAARQPVPAGQRTDRGTRPRAGPAAAVRGGTTEVHTSGRHWWTLGFEATGPAGLLRSTLQAAATIVFAQALPGRVEPGPDESRSYAQWLGQRPGAGQ